MCAHASGSPCVQGAVFCVFHNCGLGGGGVAVVVVGVANVVVVAVAVICFVKVANVAKRV